MNDKPETPKNRQEPAPSPQPPASSGKDELTNEDLDKATGGLVPAVAPQH
jgi:hypothetical protein